jgi:hypothetical protein
MDDRREGGLKRESRDKTCPYLVFRSGLFGDGKVKSSNDHPVTIILEVQTCETRKAGKPSNHFKRV